MCERERFIEDAEKAARIVLIGIIVLIALGAGAMIFWGACCR